MTTMRLDAYEAMVEFDDAAALLHGEVINLTDVITFQGRSVEELRQAFTDSVADYLDFCRTRGEEPEQPFSGQLFVKVDPALHRAVVTAARRSGVTPDEWVSRTLAKATA